MKPSIYEQSLMPQQEPDLAPLVNPYDDDESILKALGVAPSPDNSGGKRLLSSGLDLMFSAAGMSDPYQIVNRFNQAKEAKLGMADPALGDMPKSDAVKLLQDKVRQRQEKEAELNRFNSGISADLGSGAMDPALQERLIQRMYGPLVKPKDVGPQDIDQNQVWSMVGYLLGRMHSGGGVQNPLTIAAAPVRAAQARVDKENETAMVNDQLQRKMAGTELAVGQDNAKTARANKAQEISLKQKALKDELDQAQTAENNAQSQLVRQQEGARGRFNTAKDAGAVQLAVKTLKDLGISVDEQDVQDKLDKLQQDQDIHAQNANARTEAVQRNYSADWNKRLRLEMSQTGEVTEDDLKRYTQERQAYADEHGLNADALPLPKVGQSLQKQAFEERKSEYDRTYDRLSEKDRVAHADRVATRSIALERLQLAKDNLNPNLIADRTRAREEAKAAVQATGVQNTAKQGEKILKQLNLATARLDKLRTAKAVALRALDKAAGNDKETVRLKASYDEANTAYQRASADLEDVQTQYDVWKQLRNVDPLGDDDVGGKTGTGRK